MDKYTIETRPCKNGGYKYIINSNTLTDEIDCSEEVCEVKYQSYTELICRLLNENDGRKNQKKMLKRDQDYFKFTVRGELNMFKAYDNKNKKWLDSFMITPNGMVVIRQKQGGWMNFNDVIVDATLCRGTGLKDKNGVEIFCGDIIKMFDRTNPSVFEILQITEKNNELMCGGYTAFDRLKFTNAKFWNHTEIIGNIFDTPHLLEAK